ncbi:MAG: protease pro-enzyme activation domain-containing protein, partial [Steroidobacteraceae bacterium]
MKPGTLTHIGAFLIVLTGSGFSRAQETAATLNSVAQAQSAQVRLTGTVSPWLSRAASIGPADENQRVVITAYLSWRNQTELEQLVADQSTPGSSRYGQFLSPAQFHAAFSPKTEDVTRVQEALQVLGFKIKNTPASGLFVQASGTVAQVKQAFQVSQNRYSFRGKTLRAHAEDPTLPAALVHTVTYIGGLDDSHLLMRPASTQGMRLAKSSGLPSVLVPPRAAAAVSPATGSSFIPPSELMPPYGGPSNFPCSHYWGDTKANLQTAAPFPYLDNNLPWTECGYTPQQIHQAYGSDKVGETGRGIRIAITDIYTSPTIVADVNQYSANHGLPRLTPENFQQILLPGAHQVPSNDPCGYQSWWTEQTLDVTAVHSMAPRASIVYVGGACDELDSVDGG